MSQEHFAVIRVMLFIIFSICLLMLSWQPLHNPKCHGFYRFFVFEGILILVLMNYPFWFQNPFSPLQLVSWLLLFSSILLVLRGIFLLKKSGGTGRKRNTENLPFENTVYLVKDGIYHYIRHPMYSSLLLLAWGAFFKQITLFSVMAVLPTTALIVVTAKVEERENISFFGRCYKEYREKTRMFIPWLF